MKIVFLDVKTKLLFILVTNNIWCARSPKPPGKVGNMELKIGCLDLKKAHEIEEKTLKNAIDFLDVPFQDDEEDENEEQ